MAKKQGYNMTLQYIENFRMLMCKLARNKKTRFGNVRDVRNYLQDSVGERSLRLRSKYGDDWSAEDELYLLTELDIARPYKKYMSIGKNDSIQEYKG